MTEFFSTKHDAGQLRATAQSPMYISGVFSETDMSVDRPSASDLGGNAQSASRTNLLQEWRQGSNLSSSGGSGRTGRRSGSGKRGGNANKGESEDDNLEVSSSCFSVLEDARMEPTGIAAEPPKLVNATDFNEESINVDVDVDQRVNPVSSPTVGGGVSSPTVRRVRRQVSFKAALIEENDEPHVPKASLPHGVSAEQPSTTSQLPPHLQQHTPPHLMQRNPYAPPHVANRPMSASRNADGQGGFQAASHQQLYMQQQLAGGNCYTGPVAHGTYNMPSLPIVARPHSGHPPQLGPLSQRPSQNNLIRKPSKQALQHPHGAGQVATLPPMSPASVSLRGGEGAQWCTTAKLTPQISLRQTSTATNDQLEESLSKNGEGKKKKKKSSTDKTVSSKSTKGCGLFSWF